MGKAIYAPHRLCASNLPRNAGTGLDQRCLKLSRGESARCCSAPARPPSQNTLQVRPGKLRGGIHAAKGPATVGGQGPVVLVGAYGMGKQYMLGFKRIARSLQPNVLKRRSLMP